MGGFASLLGHSATGFEQARQQDLQRQFEDEQARRSVLTNFLGKLATDETVHPEVRNAAAQGVMGVAQTPLGKSLKWNSVVDPVFQAASAVHPRPSQTFTPPPQPPLQVGDTSIPAPKAGVTLQPPPAPPGIYKPVEDVTAMQAARVGAVTGAEAGAQAKFPVMQIDPATGQMKQSFASGTGQPIGGSVDNAFNPMMMRGFASMIHPVSIVGPDGTPIPALQNKLTREVYDQDGNIIPNAQVFAPSLVTKTTGSSTTTPGGLTTTKTQTTKPVLPGTGGVKLTSPPAPSGASTGVSATPKAKGIGKTPPLPPAVEAEMDNMMMYGMPAGKMNDAQALALRAMKRQGIDPQIAATSATRSMADKGRMILPLIAKARQLIAADPKALGPLAGRWSELEQKYGNLQGAPKELAGTLISIYSMAGGLHGWRAMQVADKFAREYGDLSNDAKSLESGLKAMENTANVAVKVAYPGAASNGPKPGDIEDGFRFKGGDPADQKNWEKAP